MSLSQPAERELFHTRTVTCKGYKRKDGLYDIEGHLVDTKSFDFDNVDRGGTIHAGESLHEMRVRLTLDLALNVIDAEAVTEWAPFNVCSQAAVSVKSLKGLQIGPGWRSQVNRLLGKTAGCTHITEMLGPMATTAFQTMGAEWKSNQTDDTSEPPRLLNSCYALSESSPIVKREWPTWYRPVDRDNG